MKKRRERLPYYDQRATGFTTLALSAATLAASLWIQDGAQISTDAGRHTMEALEWAGLAGVGVGGLIYALSWLGVAVKAASKN